MSIPGLKYCVHGISHKYVNTKVYVWRMGRVVVDTGQPNQWAKVKPFVQAEPTDCVAVSHHHEDHAGNGGRIQRELGIPVSAPAPTTRLLRYPMTQEYYRRVIWGDYTEAITYTPHLVMPAEGMVIPAHEGVPQTTLLPIFTPGHSIDHHCFLVPERGLLFSGDLFVARHRVYYRFEETAWQELESIEKVAQLDFDTVLCSHRGIIPKGKAVIKERMQFMQDLQGNVAALREKGLPYSAITEKLLGREGGMYYFTLGDFSKYQLVSTILKPQSSASS